MVLYSPSHFFFFITKAWGELENKWGGQGDNKRIIYCQTLNVFVFSIVKWYVWTQIVQLLFDYQLQLPCLMYDVHSSASVHSYGSHATDSCTWWRHTWNLKFGNLKLWHLKFENSVVIMSQILKESVVPKFHIVNTPDFCLRTQLSNCLHTQHRDYQVIDNTGTIIIII